MRPTLEEAKNKGFHSIEGYEYFLKNVYGAKRSTGSKVWVKRRARWGSFKTAVNPIATRLFGANWDDLSEYQKAAVKAEYRSQ